MVSKRGLPGPVSVILAASFLVYFNSLWGGFVYDDTVQVLENRWITGVRHIPEIFTSGVWSFDKYSRTNYYRPLMHVVYMLDYRLFGLAPWGYHLVSILFHAGVSVLVFLLASALSSPSRAPSASPYLAPPFLAAMLFAVHPVHTEAVAWIAGVPDISFTFFYLLSLHLYIRSGPGYGTPYAFSVAFFLLASFCKETALTLPLILAAYDYAFKRRSGAPLASLKRYVPYLAVVSLYLAMRYNALGGMVPVVTQKGFTPYSYAINALPLFSYYLLKLIFPVNLSGYYVLHPIGSLFEAKGMLSLAVTAAFVSSLLAALRRDRAAFFGLLLFMVPILPALYIPAARESVFAERYLYLPSFGFLLVVSPHLSRAAAGTVRSAALVTALVLVFGIYSFGTVSRNAVWRDSYTFWSDAVKKAPDGGSPHYDLGLALSAQGRVDEAVKEYETALRLKPGYVPALNNLGYAYSIKGLTGEAIKKYKEALALDPGHAQSHYNLGRAYMEKGQPGDAGEQFKETIRLSPDHADAHNNLGIILAEEGRLDEATAQFETAVRLRPDGPGYRSNLQRAYALREKAGPGRGGRNVTK